MKLLAFIFEQPSYPSIEHNKVWFNEDVHLCVTIEYLYRFCTWQSMLNVFRLVYTRIFIDNYPPNLFDHKNATFGLYEYNVERSGCWFKRKRDLAGTDL